MTNKKTESGLAENIVSNELYKDVSNLKRCGNVVRCDIGDRYYLCATPELTISSKKTYGLLLFYHGSRDIAWVNALTYTSLATYAKEYNLCVVFGQATGEVRKPEIHPKYCDASFGDIYWEIREDRPQFHKDIKYTQDVIVDMSSRYSIDKERIYFIGHSNGGVFGMILALHLPDTFRKIVSHVGGIGWDPRFYLDFLIVEGKRKTPVLFYTGEHDIHLKPCQAGFQILQTEGFPVEIHVESGIGHVYLKACEKYLLDWLTS